ncbi:MAG TPA: hypothetical protein PKJ51_04685, partial [Methanothrix sp.]|nr:hypothetical protein [Methanothrix sp.]
MRALAVTGRLAEGMVREAVGGLADVLVMDVDVASFITPKMLMEAKPEGYDPKQYELLARVYAAGWDETFEKYDPIPNHKTDTNNHGPMSTDNIGYS